jgi:hypothetical protein
MSYNLVHLAKASSSIDFTEAGSVISLRAAQPKKALLPIDSILPPSVTEVREEQ